MTDIDLDFDDLDLDDLLETGDLDTDDLEDIELGTDFDISDAPDPMAGGDVTPVRFGSYGGSVEFEDGTVVTNPYEGADGTLYPGGPSSYVNGDDPHTLGADGIAYRS